MNELPSDILVQICQDLTVQECVRGIGLVCKRFHSVIQCSGEIWKTLQTDVEFSTDSFQSTIVKQAKHFRHLGLRCSQKRVHNNNLDLYIENTLGLGVNLKTLDLSFITSMTTIDFIKCMHSLKVLKVYGCTSIDAVNMLRCLKQCKTLVAPNISDCIQLSEDEHISGLVEVCKILKCLKLFKAEWICKFTPQTARVMLQTNKLNKFAVTPSWSPPTVWIELMRQYEDVQFGKCLMSQWERVNLSNYLYAEEQDELDL